ncbi:MAG: hypothetical protein ACLS69_05240 [Butyricicoccus sp.]
MQEFLNNIIPNVMAKLPDFAAIGDTLLMVVWSGAIVLGLTLGVLIAVTKPAAFWKTKSSIRFWTSWSACSVPSRSSSC